MCFIAYPVEKTAPTDSELKDGASRGINLRLTAAGADAVCVLANPSNPVGDRRLIAVQPESHWQFVYVPLSRGVSTSQIRALSTTRTASASSLTIRPRVKLLATDMIIE